MPALYLIRHGQASFGADDYDQLSPLGERQAEHLGAAFAAAGVIPQHIICGDMRRHRQTAEQCLLGLGSTVDAGALTWQTDPSWNEYDHLDLLQAYTAEPQVSEQILADMAGDNPRAGFQAHFARAMQRWQSGDYDGDYTESWMQFCGRISRALDAASRSSRGNIFVSTSGGVIAVVCRHLLGLADANAAELSWQLVNAGYSKVLSGQSGLKLASINEHSHFDGRHRELLSYR